MRIGYGPYTIVCIIVRVFELINLGKWNVFTMYNDLEKTIVVLYEYSSEFRLKGVHNLDGVKTERIILIFS